jgi:hypothetical protein
MPSIVSLVPEADVQTVCNKPGPHWILSYVLFNMPFIPFKAVFADT